MGPPLLGHMSRGYPCNICLLDGYCMGVDKTSRISYTKEVINCRLYA